MLLCLNFKGNHCEKSNCFNGIGFVKSYTILSLKSNAARSLSCRNFQYMITQVQQGLTLKTKTEKNKKIGQNLLKSFWDLLEWDRCEWAKNTRKNKNLLYVRRAREGLAVLRHRSPVDCNGDARLLSVMKGYKISFYWHPFSKGRVCPKNRLVVCPVLIFPYATQRFFVWIFSQKFHSDFPFVLNSIKPTAVMVRADRFWVQFYAVQQEAEPWNLSSLIPNNCNPSLRLPLPWKNVKQRPINHCPRIRGKKTMPFWRRTVIRTRRKSKSPFLS